MIINPDDLKRVKKPEDPKDRNVVFYNNIEVSGFDDGLTNITFSDTPGEIQTQLDNIKVKYPLGFDDTFLKLAKVNTWLLRK